MSDKFDSAFPTTDPNYEARYASMGMSKREYFAGLAMQNMAVAHNPGGYDHSKPDLAPQVAQAAVAYADALLAALSAPKDRP